MTQYYEIRIKGHIDLSWSDWLDGLIIAHQINGETLLSGAVADQAALHGLLNKLRDMGVQLISVNPVENPPANNQADMDEQ